MPVTPFHLGPALIVDSFIGRWFSLGAFAVVQVAIELESLWNLAAGNARVHTNLHTLIGATVLSVLLVVPCRLALDRLSHSLRRRLSSRTDVLQRFAPLFRPVTWVAAFVGCLVGGVSHVVLDAVIHADVRSFSPWSDANPFLISGSFGALHGVCAALGRIGLPVWLWLRLRPAPRAESPGDAEVLLD